MNIEIANRLVQLRKDNSYSQEALAEKLGISRQAVSKWERAEASPDTDNLILLARLYGISLDELLKTEEDIPKPYYEETVIPEPAYEERQRDEEKYENVENGINEDPDEYVDVSLGGVHVKDRDGSEVHVGWDGIHVDDKKNKQNVHIDKHGIYENGKKRTMSDVASIHYFPIEILIVIVYLCLGFLWGAWHPAWLIFFMIPMWHTFVQALKKRNPVIFAYPVLVSFLFLCLGFFFGMWHPGWLIFLTIPLYYPFVGYIMRKVEEDSDYWEEGADE